MEKLTLVSVTEDELKLSNGKTYKPEEYDPSATFPAKSCDSCHICKFCSDYDETDVATDFLCYPKRKNSDTGRTDGKFIMWVIK
jgi:hypothetical protein